MSRARSKPRGFTTVIRLLQSDGELSKGPDTFLVYGACAGRPRGPRTAGHETRELEVAVLDARPWCAPTTRLCRAVSILAVSPSERRQYAWRIHFRWITLGARRPSAKGTPQFVQRLLVDQPVSSSLACPRV